MSSIIRHAAEFARQAHLSIDQRRKYSNEPYIVHPEAVAKIVASVTQDEEMICAAWLHDVVEDTPVSITEIAAEFGKGIALLVDDLTDVSQSSDGNRERRIAIDREHTAKASQRAKTVKLADVIDNLTGIIEANVKFAARYIREKQLLMDVLTEGDVNLWSRASELINDTKLELARLLKTDQR